MIVFCAVQITVYREVHVLVFCVVRQSAVCTLEMPLNVHYKTRDLYIRLTPTSAKFSRIPRKPNFVPRFNNSLSFPL